MIFDASTVLVLRDADDGVEVFMVQRHGKSSFMANAWVYPGGRLDDADTRPDVLARIIGEVRLDVDSPTRAAGLYLAAIRETFEEAGLLLARQGGEPDYVNLNSSPRYAEYRGKLQRGEESLSVVAEREDLSFPLDELAYFAHWITPTFESKRFDTFFFLARAPQHQEPLHDERETTDSFWIRPAEAVARFEAGEFYLPPPTQRTLERLAAFDNVEAAFASTIGKTPPCIIPHWLDQETGPMLLLPGDPEYPGHLPEYAGATAVDGPTRMKLVAPS